MASHRATPLTALALAIAAIAASLIAAAPSHAAEASASASSGCGRVSLTPASKKVRRGGKVLLTGTACSASYSSGGASQRVKLQLEKKKRRWKTVGTAVADASGQFSVCTKVRVSKRTKVARIKAIGPGGSKGGTKLKVTRKGPSGCGGSNGGGASSPAPSKPATGGGGAPPSQSPASPPPPPAASGLSVLRWDPATNPDPLPLWSSIDAENASRHQQFTSGGPQGGPFRRMTVMDGDDHSGERAELGYNSRLGGLGAPWGTFYVYNENQRRITDFSMRLPTNYPISSPTWQVVAQMKQAGPSANSGGTPVLALEARDGDWVLTQSDSPGASSNTHELWSTPATLGVWTHISLDVTYSPDPTRGKVQISVGGVKSPTFTTFTQKYELSPAGEGLVPGDAIASHLRMGVYHNSALPGTHVDFANVRVSG